MSIAAITAHGTTALSGATFRTHHRGGHGTSADFTGIPAIGEPGQLPVGVGQGLVSGAVHALAKSISGSPAAGPAAAAAPGTTPTATSGSFRPGVAGSNINTHA